MVLVTICLWMAMKNLIAFLFLWFIFIHHQSVVLSGKSSRLGIVWCRDYENGLGDHVTIKGHDGPDNDLLSLNYIQKSPNSYFFGEVRPSRRSVVSKLLKWTCWPYGHQGPWWSNKWSSFSELYSDIPEQLRCLGSLDSDTVHLGIVLCWDYENGLGDHMAIKGHDGPASDFLSVNYI